jgi:hypothetical protein
MSDRARRERLRQRLLKDKHTWLSLFDSSEYSAWRRTLQAADALKSVTKERVRALRSRGGDGSSALVAMATDSAPRIAAKPAALTAKSVSSRASRRLHSSSLTLSSDVEALSTLVPPLPDVASPDVDVGGGGGGGGSEFDSRSAVRPLLEAAVLLGFNEREHHLDPNDFLFASNAHSVELLQCAPPDAPLASSIFGDLVRFVAPRGVELTRRPVDPSFAAFVLTDVKGDRLYCTSLKLFEPCAVRPSMRIDAATSAQRSSLRVAVALHDFRAAKSTELSFAANDQIILTNTTRADGWWLGRRLREPQIGWFPAAFVRVVDEPVGDVAASRATGDGDAHFVAKWMVLISTEPRFELLRQLCESLMSTASGADIGAVLGDWFRHVRVPPPDSRVTVQLSVLGRQMRLRPRLAFACTAPVRAILHRVGPHALLRAVTSLLAEQRVVLVSDHQPLIAAACEAFMDLMQPLAYFHTYISLLPASLRDCLGAPTPYVQGVLRNVFDAVSASDAALLEGTVVVDLDSGETFDRSDAGAALFDFPPAMKRQMLRWIAAAMPLPAALHNSSAGAAAADDDDDDALQIRLAFLAPLSFLLRGVAKRHGNGGEAQITEAAVSLADASGRTIDIDEVVRAAGDDQSAAAALTQLQTFMQLQHASLCQQNDAFRWCDAVAGCRDLLEAHAVLDAMLKRQRDEHRRHAVVVSLLGPPSIADAGAPVALDVPRVLGTVNPLLRWDERAINARREPSAWLVALDAALDGELPASSRADLLLCRALHRIELGAGVGAFDDLAAALQSKDEGAAARFAFVREQRVALLHARLFPLLEAGAVGGGGSNSGGGSGDAGDDDEEEDEDDSSFVSAESEVGDGDGVRRSARQVLIDEFQLWSARPGGAADELPRSGSAVRRASRAAARQSANAAICEFLRPSFDPALIVSELSDRKQISARRFVRWATEKALVRDEFEAERLALAIGVSRHAKKQKSLVDVAALCDLIFAIKSVVAFTNKPPYARRFVLRDGEFVIKASAIRVAVPESSSRPAYAILTNARLFIASDDAMCTEIDVNTLLLAEASIGRLDRASEAMPLLVVYTLRGSATPTAVIGLFARSEAAPWCAAINELVVATRLQDELADAQMTNSAARRLVLIEALNRVPRAAQVSRLFSFQSFHASRAAAIGDALHEVGLLNGASVPPAHEQLAPLELSMSLLRAAIGLLLANVTADGASVDFAPVLAGEQWKEFMELAATLQRAQLETLSAPALVSFLVNVHNVMIVAAYALCGVPQDAVGATLVRRFACFDIGGQPFTPLVIVQGLLRANASGVLAAGDARLRLACRRADPRVFVLLSTFAPLSPPTFLLNADSPARLQCLLDAATKEFLNEFVAVDADRNVVVLPPLFREFESDFCDDAAQLSGAVDLVHDEDERDALLLLAWLKHHCDPDDLGARLGQLSLDKPLGVQFLTEIHALSVRPFRQSM